MPAKVYKVTLSDEEKIFLNNLTSKGKGAAQKLNQCLYSFESGSK
jgi:hypothetical protein